MLTQGAAPDSRHTRVFISPKFVSRLFAVGYLFFDCRLIVLGYLYDVNPIHAGGDSTTFLVKLL